MAIQTNNVEADDRGYISLSGGPPRRPRPGGHAPAVEPGDPSWAIPGCGGPRIALRSSARGRARDRSSP